MVNYFSRRTDLGGGVVVIGLGRFGQALALELMNSGTEVMGIDSNPEAVQEMNGRLTQVMCADTTKSEVLDQLGIADFSKVVVAIGSNLAASVLTVSAVLRLNGPEVWAKASSKAQAQILEQLGVEHVFNPEADMGRRAAHLVTRSLLDYFELGYGFAMVSTRPPKMLVGKVLGKTNLRRDRGVSVIAIRDESDSSGWVPAHAQSVLNADDVVLMVGPVKEIEAACD